MDIKEAKSMEGTEFTYEFETGDTIKAYVKKFDPEKGLSCWALSFVTDEGHTFAPLNEDEEKEGAFCVVGFDFILRPEEIDEALGRLEEIKTTGRLVRPKEVFSKFLGCPL
jgi:hypothetical protein